MTTNIFSMGSHYVRYRVIFKFWKESKKLWARRYCVDAKMEEKDVFVSKIKEDSSGNIVAQFFNGSCITFSSGKLAKLADGSVTVHCNESTVMATAVSNPASGERQSESFTPLTISYHQKAAALGRIPLNYLRREIGQTESEILTSRVIDRSLRPLFPKGFNWETQIICNSLALDGSTFPDVLAINAASAALAVSSIPWNGPVAAVRVGLIGERVVINPGKNEINESSLNLIVACRKKKKIIMLEGSADNIYVQDFFKALREGLKECTVILSAISTLKEKFGKETKVFAPSNIPPDIKSQVEELASDELEHIFMNHEHNKLSRDNEISCLREKVMDALKEKVNGNDLWKVRAAFDKVCKDNFRKVIWSTGIRCDGRKETELRPINCEVDLFKPLHGSSLFQRGHTQVFCTVALDSPSSAMKMDRISSLTSNVKEKNFFLHYEFPPFATNEVKRVGPLGRREIGHGILAEKALRSSITANFPFTIRLTAEVFESNGSSSMATVCGGSLALMDAGVPLQSSVAGVALGLLVEYCEENPSEISNYKILTDIMGIEDYFGDMDFKLAGTQKTLTAVQMDLKNDGITMLMLTEIINAGKNAISEILKEMNKVCGSARVQKKENWPDIHKMIVPIHQRSKFIGHSGFNIKKLELDCGVQISEEGFGEFFIFAPNKEALAEAKQKIESSLAVDSEPVLEFGGVYKANITEIKEHGCMVTLYPTMKPVLIPMSQLAQRKVSHPSALGMEVGQEIHVKYFGRDPVSGMMRLSRKVLLGLPSQVPLSLTKNEEPEPEKLQQPSSES